MLHRQLSARWPETLACAGRFLVGYGPETGAYWVRFRMAAEGWAAHRDRRARAQVLAAARRTFVVVVGEWLVGGSAQ